MGGPHPRVSDSVGLGWCPIICILTGSQVMPGLLVREAHLRTGKNEAHLPMLPARESRATSWSRVPVYVSATGLLGARCLALRTHRTSFAAKPPNSPSCAQLSSGSRPHCLPTTQLQPQPPTLSPMLLGNAGDSHGPRPSSFASLFSPVPFLAPSVVGRMDHSHKHTNILWNLSAFKKEG